MGGISMKKTRNFAEVIRAKLSADPEMASRVGAAAFNSDIAQKVLALRISHKLTQKQLAERVDTAQSVISRIEDADYEGHSLGLLKRIAESLGKTIRVEFCDPPTGNGATDRKSPKSKSK